MKHFPINLCLGLAALLLGACAGSGDVRITEGSETIGEKPAGTLFVTSQASLVHVDERERLATIRRGNRFEEGAFLEAVAADGQRSGLLKAQPRSLTALRTAFILEGEPAINDSVREVNAAEAARLAAKYPEAADE